jgi:hypothetical protein
MPIPNLIIKGWNPIPKSPKSVICSGKSFESCQGHQSDVHLDTKGKKQAIVISSDEDTDSDSKDVGSSPPKKIVKSESTF